MSPPTSQSIQADADDIRRHIELMKKYLNLRVTLEDWRGVAEAASSLRELASSLSTLCGLLT